MFFFSFNAWKPSALLRRLWHNIMWGATQGGSGVKGATKLGLYNVTAGPAMQCLFNLYKSTLVWCPRNECASVFAPINIWQKFLVLFCLSDSTQLPNRDDQMQCLSKQCQALLQSWPLHCFIFSQTEFLLVVEFCTFCCFKSKNTNHKETTVQKFSANLIQWSFTLPTGNKQQLQTHCPACWALTKMIAKLAEVKNHEKIPIVQKTQCSFLISIDLGKLFNNMRNGACCQQCTVESKFRFLTGNVHVQVDWTHHVWWQLFLVLTFFQEMPQCFMQNGKGLCWCGTDDKNLMRDGAEKSIRITIWGTHDWRPSIFFVTLGKGWCGHLRLSPPSDKDRQPE